MNIITIINKFILNRRLSTHLVSVLIAVAFHSRPRGRTSFKFTFGFLLLLNLVVRIQFKLVQPDIHFLRRSLRDNLLGWLVQTFDRLNLRRILFYDHVSLIVNY